MTDKLKGVIVTFADDIREDDAQQIIDAIGMIKGVIDVSKSVLSPEDKMNRVRVHLEYREKLLKALDS